MKLLKFKITTITICQKIYDDLIRISRTYKYVIVQHDGISGYNFYTMKSSRYQEENSAILKFDNDCFVHICGSVIERSVEFPLTIVSDSDSTRYNLQAKNPSKTYQTLEVFNGTSEV